MEENTAEITPFPGGYYVSFQEGPQPLVHRVMKDKTCSCSVARCRAVQSVRDYLKSGGEVAPDAKTPTPKLGPVFRRKWGMIEYWERVNLGRKRTLDYFRDLSRLSQSEMLSRYNLEYELVSPPTVKTGDAEHLNPL